uniref:hypothetical protein n=1 Tax=Nonomuraea sp. CA-251285 TaxID=3240002 RepID=UPI003F4912E4
MTGVCPQCGETYSVPSRRGSKVGNYSCPTCAVPLQGRGAGKKRHKYRDLLRRGLFVWDGEDPGYVALTAAMALAPWKDDPTSWRGPETVPGTYDQEIIDRAGGKVFGPGCVVDPEHLDPEQWPYLVPAPAPGEYDPAAFVESNGPVVQVKCKACGDVLTEPIPRPQEAWTPVRAFFWPPRTRHLSYLQKPTKPGPHKAGTPACPRCYPAAWPQHVQNRYRRT